MAKRRKLEAPSAEDLGRIEAEFERGAGQGARAPIAQVAAESAALIDPRPVADREAAARDRSDAQRLRDAEGQGLVMLELALDEIDADALVRDRVVLDAEAMEELKASIARGGVRLPIEVFEREGETPRYGLLSGYRRLKAVRDLRSLTGDGKYDTIRAVLRAPAEMGGPFAAMVEENEIRASLSHFERGRIAVIAAQQGAFANTEEAVNELFPVASKAKRSKIRSFALIFEELGDMLTFPDLLKERDGLRLAAALREGGEATLREALAEQVPQTPAEEAELLQEALEQITIATDPRKGGRPKKPAARSGRKAVLSSGVTLAAQQDGAGWMIRLNGARVDRELVEVAMQHLASLLEAPDRG